MTRIKQRRRGYTRLSGKNQVTIPVAAVERARLAPGRELRVDVTDEGGILLTPVPDLTARRRAAIAATAGALAGVYPPGDLERLRDEWRSS